MSTGEKVTSGGLETFGFKGGSTRRDTLSGVPRGYGVVTTDPWVPWVQDGVYGSLCRRWSKSYTYPPSLPKTGPVVKGSQGTKEI